MDIFLDFDNTIVNTTKAICNLYNEDFKYYKDFYPINWWEINTWDFTELNCAKPEYINTYFNQSRFWEELDFLPDALEVIEELALNYRKIYIVSMGYSPNLLGKKEFIDNYIGNFHIEFIPIDCKKYKNKSHIDMSNGIFVDDSSNQLMTSNAGQKIAFGDVRSWNENWAGERCHTWADVARLLL